MHTIRYAAVLSVLTAFAPVASKADDDPMKPAEAPWRIILKEQLRSEKGCDLNDVLAYQEIPLGEDVGVDGRISCFDGREFNFTRKGKHEKFSIQICAPAVC
jgi:hypothetical protein